MRPTFGLLSELESRRTVDAYAASVLTATHSGSDALAAGLAVAIRLHRRVVGDVGFAIGALVESWQEPLRPRLSTGRWTSGVFPIDESPYLGRSV